MACPFDLELEFTETYKRHLHDDPAIREAYCLQVLIPHLFDPPQPGDLFVGRIHYLPVGFGLEDAAGGPIYYCNEKRILSQLDSLETEQREKVREMVDFWRTEATISGHLIRRLSPEVLTATTKPLAEMMGRLSGSLLNFEKLVKLGI